MQIVVNIIRDIEAGGCQPHCPKNNLSLRIKTNPVNDGADATVYVRNNNHERFGFYAEIQIL